MGAVSALKLKIMRRHAGDAAAMMRALSHEARLRVLCDLVERSGLSQSALSQHLARLRLDGLVATRREAQTIFYRIADPDAARILGVLYQIYCKR